MNNREMEKLDLEKLDLEELDRAPGGEDTDEELKYWEFRDKMLKKYGFLSRISDMKDYNVLTYLRDQAKASREKVNSTVKAWERGEL